MTNSLIEKMRAARRSEVAVGGFVFTVARPTDMQMLGIKDKAPAQLLREFVVDWRGVHEINLIPGGSPVDVPFEPDLFIEWAADNPQVWEPLLTAIMESYRRHDAARAALEKKPEAG